MPEEELAASRFPSGLNATLLKLARNPSGPLKVSRCSPVTASHTFTVLSEETVASRVPSGLKIACLTATSVCPLMGKQFFAGLGVPNFRSSVPTTIWRLSVKPPTKRAARLDCRRCIRESNRAGYQDQF